MPASGLRGTARVEKTQALCVNLRTALTSFWVVSPSEVSMLSKNASDIGSKYQNILVSKTATLPADITAAEQMTVKIIKKPFSKISHHSSVNASLRKSIDLYNLEKGQSSARLWIGLAPHT